MRFLILDRDGVINKESEEFIKSPAEWIPIPGSLEAIAREEGLAVLDVTDAYGEVDRKTLWVAAWDRHPNALGHRMIADALYRLIEKDVQLLMPGP